MTLSDEFSTRQGPTTATTRGVHFVGRLGTFDASAFEHHLPGVLTIRHLAELPGLF